MAIFGFLFGLGCLIVIAWAITLLSHAVFGRQRGQSDQRHEQPSAQPTQFRERSSSQPTIAAPPTPTVSRRRVVAPQEQP